ncbi:MAG: excinuclease ABC subunit UvrA, partial [Solirubrobacteraceae bacterium]
MDSIEGLSPAISIDQKTTSRNPRSTVGTVTEIYDYLRLLWSRVGKPHCPKCGREIVGQSAEQIIDQVMELGDGTRFMVMAPVVRGRKGEYGKLLDELRADGFARVKIDDRLRMLEESIVLDKRYKHDISVVVDRLVMRHDLRKRLADSIETAVGLAEGLVEIEIMGSGSAVMSDGSGQGFTGGRSGGGGQGRGAAEAQPEESGHATGAKGTRKVAAQIVPGEVPPEGTIFTFSERFACPVHGPSLVELEPRIFSFNSPHGACPRCTGLGAQMEIDPELIVPDPELSIAEGALAPWAGSSSNYYEQVTEAIAERYGVDLDIPWEDLPADERELFLSGTDERLAITYRNRFGRTRRYATKFEGIVKGLERRYRESESEGTKEKIEQFMSLRPCPECGGARLRAESRAVLVGGTPIDEFCALSARRALEWLGEVELSETDRHVARLILREIDERLRFLENVGIGYLSMDRAAATLSGGEAQRIRLATQIGSSLVGVLYILDEPSIGLH